MYPHFGDTHGNYSNDVRIILVTLLRLEGVSKRFARTLPARETLYGRLHAALGGPPVGAEVWALRDVSLAVAPGECVGLVGPNGSGKSTLLKVAAGIYEPSVGVVKRGGRAAAFLGLGHAWRAELSARENAELGLVLMGLSRRAARARLDTVLDFAGLGDAAEVRLAELSTGQAARLAFAAALGSDAELFFIDELITVGDIAFQERCVAAVAERRRAGAAFLVATHDERLLARIGARTLRLEAGCLSDPCCSAS